MKKTAILLLNCVLFAFGCDSSDEQTVAPAQEIEVSPVEIEFDALGQLVSATSEVTVDSQGPWRLSGDTEWCTPSLYEGDNGDVVTFVAAINPEVSEREVVFSLMTEDRVARITVRQAGGDRVELIDGGHVEVGNASHTLYLPVRSNVDAYEISVSDEAREWLSTSELVGDSQLYYLPVVVAANESYEPRRGEITLRAGTSQPLLLTVVQQQTDHLEVDGVESPIEVAKEGEILEVTLRSNHAYEVAIPASCAHWLTRITEPASIPEFDGGMKVVCERFEIAESGAGMRVAQVTFSIPGTTETLVLKQATDNPVFGNFPDAKLRSWIVDNGYGLETAPESERLELTETLLYLTEIDLSGREITSIAGLEVIEGLESLNCSKNSIERLDVSVFPNLTTLALTGNPLTLIELGDVAIHSLTFESYYAFNAGGTWGGAMPTVCVFSSAQLEEINAPNCSFSGSGLTLDVKGCPSLKRMDLGTWYGPGKVLLSSLYHDGTVEITKPQNTALVYE